MLQPNTFQATRCRRQNPRRAGKKRRKGGGPLPAKLPEGGILKIDFGTQTNPSRLPIEITARVLAYADVKDVPNVAATCMEWREALRLAEAEGLWLSLIRKHHPAVETIMTIKVAEESSRVMSNNEGAEYGGGMPLCQEGLPRGPDKRGSSYLTALANVPPPSLDWKEQFQRRHMFVKAALSPDPIPTPPPRPLSSYVAQVDLTCRTANDAKVGLASVLCEDLDFELDAIGLNLGDVGPQLSSLCRSGGDFRRFDLSVHLVQRSTGRQTLLYSGPPEDWVDESMYVYEDFHNFDALPMLRAHSPDVMSYAMLVRTGCPCHCAEEQRAQGFFLPPPPPPPHEEEDPGCDCGFCSSSGRSCCRCCSCSEKWSCFHRYRVTIRLIRGLMEFDFDEMDQDECLRFLQDGLIYS